VNARSCASVLVSSLLVLACSAKPKPAPSPGPSASTTTLRIGIAGEVVTVPPNVLKVERSADPQSDWWQVRDKAVERLIELSKSGDPRRLGFLAPPDRRGLVVLDPLKNATVPLAELQVYKGSTEPAALITEERRLTFPIVAGDKVVSSVTLLHSNGTWIPSAYGDANTIRSVMKARIAAVTPQPGPVAVLPGKAAEYTIVTVPGVNYLFLSAKGLGNELYLIPVSTKTSLGFMAGVPMRARDAWLKLQPVAQKHSGLPDLNPKPKPAP
jgi:hypothetical protein